jgi:hypothetical protein
VADALAVERAQVPSGGSTAPGVLFVHNNGGTLRYSRVATSPATNAQEVTFTEVNTNTAPLAAGGLITDASTTYSRREPALVQIPGTQENLLVYVSSGGLLRQSSLPIGSGQVFTAPANSLTTTSATIPAARSVSMVTVGNEVWMAVAVNTSVIRLYRLSGTNTPPAAGRTWQQMVELPYATLHRPNLAAVPDREWPPF